MDCSTQASLSFTISCSLLTHVHWVSDAIHPSHPLSSPAPPAFSLSKHQVFFNQLALHNRWPKYWNFSISPSNEYWGLISFRIDRFDLLVVQGTLKNLLQDHSLKASVLQRSVFFLVQLSHPYVTTGKNPSFDYTDLCWQRIGRLLSLFFFLLRGESLVHFELTFAHDVR